MTTTQRPARRCTDHLDHQRGCPTCRTHAAWYARTRHQLLAAGQWERMVDATPVREHLTQLIAAGTRPFHIAERTGVSHRAISHIANGTSQTVHPDNAAAILAVTAVDRPNSYRDSTGAGRRIRAMVHAGRPQQWIADQSGVNIRVVKETARGQRPRILASTFDRIADLYELHAGEQVADTREQRAATLLAKRRHWLPWTAWSDDTIDDPAAQPKADEWEPVVDDVLVQRAIDGDPDALGRLTRPERVEAARRLLARPGVGVGSLSRLLNVSGQTAQRLAEQAAAA